MPLLPTTAATTTAATIAVTTDATTTAATTTAATTTTQVLQTMKTLAAHILNRTCAHARTAQDVDKESAAATIGTVG